jgi:hypothetical protein
MIGKPSQIKMLTPMTVSKSNRIGAQIHTRDTSKNDLEIESAQGLNDLSFTSILLSFVG